MRILFYTTKCQQTISYSLFKSQKEENKKYKNKLFGIMKLIIKVGEREGMRERSAQVHEKLCVHLLILYLYLY